MTQEVLAGLLGRTADWLSKVENDRLEIDRLSVLRAVADVLGVPIAQLIPDLPDIARNSDQTIRIKQAMAGGVIRYGDRVIDTADDSVTQSSVERRLDVIWVDSQNGRFGKVVDELPLVLASARQLSDSADKFDARRSASRTYAMALNAAEFTLSKLGEVELAWLAAAEGFGRAEQAEDPVLAAALARSLGHALLSNDLHDEASRLLVSHAEALVSQADVKDVDGMWSVYGTMFLAASMAAARRSNREDSRMYLAEARRAAGEIGEDANHYYTAFGPTNVAIHQVATAMELGDVHVGRELGPRILTNHLPVERQVRHALETIRSLELMGEPDRAQRQLLEVWRLAPDQIESHFLAKRIVLSLLRGKRRPTRELIRLATRMHVL